MTTRVTRTYDDLPEGVRVYFERTGNLERYPRFANLRRLPAARLPEPG